MQLIYIILLVPQSYCPLNRQHFFVYLYFIKGLELSCDCNLKINVARTIGHNATKCQKQNSVRCWGGGCVCVASFSHNPYNENKRTALLNGNG